MFKIKMLAHVRDQITGFAGTVTGRAEYVTGCRQYLVVPPMKEGAAAYPDGTWLDEDRLEIAGRKTSKSPKAAGKNKGGPQANCAPVK